LSPFCSTISRFPNCLIVSGIGTRFVQLGEHPLLQFEVEDYPLDRAAFTFDSLRFRLIHPVDPDVVAHLARLHKIGINVLLRRVLGCCFAFGLIRLLPRRVSTTTA
jgi:hypothetical protein